MADLSAIKEMAKGYYESNRVSFAILSKDSLNLFGKHVSIEQLKHWSSDDGGWKKAQISEVEKLNAIATWIFDKMEEEREDISARDLVALASTYLQFATKMPSDTLGLNQRPAMQDIMDAAKKLKNAVD